MTLEELKIYLRIDGQEDDGLINGLLLAAKEYLKNAGTAVEIGDLYELAVKLLVSHWYENRNTVLVGSISKELEFALTTIITQLRYSYDPPIEVV